MASPMPWHDQDSFWNLFGPILFNRQRLDQAAGQVEQIARLLPLEPGDQILDLPCGTGRHSLALAEHGYAVTGVDRTFAYVEQARTEAQHRGLPARFEVGDMRTYCLRDGYDVVLNLFGSFGYFATADDDLQVVANAYASLRPGGRFLIETMGKEIMARDFQTQEWSEGDGLLLLAERKATHNWSRIETHWIAIRGADRSEYVVSVRSYSAVELASLLAQCGFADINVYGNLAGSQYDQNALRLVVIGRK